MGFWRLTSLRSAEWDGGLETREELALQLKVEKVSLRGTGLGENDQTAQKGPRTKDQHK